MSFFKRKRKLSDMEELYIKQKLKQAQETAHLIQTTSSSKTFFGRLNFMLDCLLDLVPWEEKFVLSDPTPKSFYNEIIKQMPKIVDGMIDRAIEKNERDLLKYKKELTKKKHYLDFTIDLLDDFDHANEFWEGNKVSPHYTGPLFAPSNYERVKDLYKDATERLKQE